VKTLKRTISQSALSLLGALACLAACGSGSAESAETATPTPAAEPLAVEAPPTGEPATDEEVENPAPDFTLPDLDGNQVTLSALRGTTVVIEWFNPGCPFVVHAHTKGPINEMAASLPAQGIVWLAVNSGAPGKQGHGVDTNRKAVKDWKIDHPVLLDESGDVGRAYGATNTPHMYVVDPRGSLVYGGAIDNAPMGKVPAEGHVNYVALALADLAAGRPVETAETQAYGCTVKY
jgi:peroxiredoxin